MIFLQELEQPIRVIIQDNKTVVDYLLDPYLIIAGAAIVISVLALWTNRKYNRKNLELAMKQNEKSVEPEISLRGDYSFNQEEDKFYKPTLRIRNSGIGPARLSELQFIFDEKTYPRITLLLDKHFPLITEMLNTSNCKEVTDIPGTTLAQSEYLPIFELFFKTGVESSLLLAPVLTQIKIRIKYTSIYKKPKKLEQKLLGG